MRVPTWLLLLLAGLIVANIYTIVGAVQYTVNHAAPTPSFAPIARIAFAVIWIAVLALALIGLMREHSLAPVWIAPLLTLYGIAGLGWNFVFAQSSYSRGSQSFDLLVTLIVLAPVWWVALRRGWIRNPLPQTD